MGHIDRNVDRVLIGLLTNDVNTVEGVWAITVTTPANNDDRLACNHA